MVRMMNEEEIVELLWNREESGVRQLENKYEKYCMTIVMRIVNNIEDARECLNDTWLRVWNSIPPHRPENLSGYVAKISRNLALNRWQKNRAAKRGGDVMKMAIEEIQECVPGKDTPEQAVLVKEIKETIEKYLKTKDAGKRTIFLQRYFYMMELGEISDCMGIKETTIRSILSRMRKELKEYLAEEGIWL